MKIVSLKAWEYVVTAFDCELRGMRTLLDTRHRVSEGKETLYSIEKQILCEVEEEHVV